jgi:hypothetical protein
MDTIALLGRYAGTPVVRTAAKQAGRVHTICTPAAPGLHPPRLC